MNPKSKHPGGRPPLAGQAATAQIQLRTTMARKNAYVRQAQAQGQSLSQWLTAVADAAANRGG